MIVGVPREIMLSEDRVAASPETVGIMKDMGLEVLVEKNAGKGSFYSDEMYKKAGAEIVEDVEDIFNRADVILKVKEPQFDKEKNKHEVDMMHEGQYLITFIHPAAPVNHEMVQNMAKKGIISLTLDGIPRISRAQSLDALTSMSTCAGYKGIIMATERLPKFMPQMFTGVGKVNPCNALIIGAGVGGLQAIATAKRLGAIVYATDIRPDACEQAYSLGAKVIELGIDPKDAIGEGGYALALSDENLEKERKILREHVADMDVIFCSALVPGERAPMLIDEEMVKKMKNGSVIVDISIDQGGNCDITPPGEIKRIHGVTLIGIKNIPGMLPTSATWMFSQNVANFLKYLYKDGKIVLDRDDEVIAKSLTTYEGEVVHKGARKAMGLK